MSSPVSPVLNSIDLIALMMIRDEFRKFSSFRLKRVTSSVLSILESAQ